MISRMRSKIWRSCAQLLILCHLESHGPNLKHIILKIDVAGDTFQVKSDLSQQLWDMRADEIRCMGPKDMKLTFSERNSKTFQKMYTLSTSDV